MATEAVYGEKTPGYAEKSTLIIGLPSAIDKDSQFWNLGRWLALDSQLSNKQKALLIANLESAGILNYRNDFIESDQDHRVVDVALWDIEGSAEVQTAIIECAYAFSNQIPLLERTDRLIALLNKGYGLGTKFSEETSKLEITVEAFNGLEKSVYEKRKRFTQELQSLELINREEVSLLLEEYSLEEFHRQTQYDRLLIWGAYRDTLGFTDPLKQFYRLQTAAYIGYGMAARDIEWQKTAAV